MRRDAKCCVCHGFVLVAVIGYDYYCCKNSGQAGAGRFTPQASPHKISPRVDIAFLFSNLNPCHCVGKAVCFIKLWLDYHLPFLIDIAPLAANLNSCYPVRKTVCFIKVRLADEAPCLVDIAPLSTYLDCCQPLAKGISPIKLERNNNFPCFGYVSRLLTYPNRC